MSNMNSMYLKKVDLKKGNPSRINKEYRKCKAYREC